MSWNSFTERYTSGNRISPAVTLTMQDVMAASSSITWNALTPTGTTVTIEIAVSTDNGTTWGEWQVCTNGSAVPGISELGSLANVQLKIRETLTTDNAHATPELLDLTISIATAWRNIAYGPNKSTLTAWDSISLAWKSDRLSLVVNDEEACYIENPGLPAAFDSDLFIGTDRNGANAINTLVDELRIDKVYRDADTRVSWHKVKSPFYSSEEIQTVANTKFDKPGYVLATENGINVHDGQGVSRAFWGQYAQGEFGGKVMHADGSYTLMNYSGFRRHVAGNAKDYLYLMATGTRSTEYVDGYLQECFQGLIRYVRFYSGYNVVPLDGVPVNLVYDSQGHVVQYQTFTGNYTFYCSQATIGWTWIDSFFKYPTGDGVNDSGVNLITENDVLEFIPEIWVQLPNDFKGKGFSVSLSLSTFYIPDAMISGDYMIPLVGNPKFVLQVTQYDYVNARFKVKAYYQVYHYYSRPHQVINDGNIVDRNESIQIFYARGINFSYVAIA